MTGFDYFVVIVTLLSIISGASKGFVKCLLSFGAIIIGLVLALLFYKEFSHIFLFLGFSPGISPLLGFLTPLVIAFLISQFLSYRIKKALRHNGLGFIDKTAGAGVGLIRAWLFCSVMYLALAAFPVKLDMVRKAQTEPALTWGAQMLTTFASKDLIGRFENGMEQLHHLKAEVSKTVPSSGKNSGKK